MNEKEIKDFICKMSADTIYIIDLFNCLTRDLEKGNLLNIGCDVETLRDSIYKHYYDIQNYLDTHG